MNLELLKGKGAASPEPKPLSGLATPGGAVSKGAVSLGTGPFRMGLKYLRDFGEDGPCHLVLHLFY